MKDTRYVALIINHEGTEFAALATYDTGEEIEFRKEISRLHSEGIVAD